MDDKAAGPLEVRSSDQLGCVAYEAWCHAGRRIPTPWDLIDKFERAMWIAAAKAAFNAATTLDDLARSVQAESILLSEGWAWSREKSEWIKA